MSLIPRIAVYKPDEDSLDDIMHIFARHEYSLRQVSSIDEIIDLEIDEGSAFDVAVIPLKLWDGSSGMTACLRMKSVEKLAARPILGLSISTDKSLLQSFYEMGADCVMSAPFNADHVFFQICALTRQLASFDEALRRHNEGSGLSRSITTAFDCVREGLLIFNSDYELTFCNFNGRSLFGLSTPPTKDDAVVLEKYFRSFLTEHEKLAGKQSNEQYPATTFEENITRIGGQSFAGTFRVTTLRAQDGAPVGLAVAVTDLSELDQLTNTLTQAQRTRSLCLLAAGCSLNFLNATGGSDAGGIIVSPMLRLEEYLATTEKTCFLNSAITTLLEFIDLVISPNINIKVQVKNELRLAIRPADFFQLVGHMILHAVEFAGRSGETNISIGDNVPGEGVTLLVISKSRKVTPFIPNDHLANIIQGNLTPPGTTSRHENKLSIGLAAAQEVASRYRTSIEYQSNSGGAMKIRTRLPVDYKDSEKS